MLYPRLLDAADYSPSLWTMRPDDPIRAYWITVFERQGDEMLRLIAEHRGDAARDAALSAREAMQAFLTEASPDAAAASSTVHSWTVEREELLRLHGVDDPYRELKDRENEAALAALPSALARLRAEPSIEARLLLAIRGIFAGNRFDLGSPAGIQAHHQDGAAFDDLLARSEHGPFLRNDGDELLRFLDGGVQRAVVLVDNAGPDFLCGVLPFALVLAGMGIEVTLGANDTPSLNDVTMPEASALLGCAAEIDTELERLLASKHLTLIATGTGQPGIDLRDVSEALADAGSEAELLVLEGQGRAIETNWAARFDQHVLRVATLKDGMVAKAVGGQPFDHVLDFREPQRTA